MDLSINFPLILVLLTGGKSLVALALADGLSDEILFRRLVGGRPLYHVCHLLRRRRVSRLETRYLLCSPLGGRSRSSLAAGLFVARHATPLSRCYVLATLRAESAPEGRLAAVGTSTMTSVAIAAHRTRIRHAFATPGSAEGDTLVRAVVMVAVVEAGAGV